MDSVEGVAGFYGLTDGNHGSVEDGWVFPVAVGEETAGEAGVAWCVAFTLACGTPAAKKVSYSFFSREGFEALVRRSPRWGYFAVERRT